MWQRFRIHDLNRVTAVKIKKKRVVHTPSSLAQFTEGLSLRLPLSFSVYEVGSESQARRSDTRHRVVPADGRTGCGARLDDTQRHQVDAETPTSGCAFLGKSIIRFNRINAESGKRQNQLGKFVLPSPALSDLTVRFPDISCSSVINQRTE
jgi:hypothetical protein